MASKTFHLFQSLPREIQDHIWSLAMETPTVQSLEIFSKLDRVSGWAGTTRFVQSIQATDPGHGLAQKTAGTPVNGDASLAPEVKIAIPQISSDKPLFSGYYANLSRLARVNSAAYEAVSHATKMRARDPALPQVHIDLSGHKPTIPLLMNVEHDLVYIKQPITMGPYRPTVWDVIKTARTERENSETLRPEIASQGQTESIQHILLPYRSAKHRRLCLG
jgi:hypothetical protein